MIRADDGIDLGHRERPIHSRYGLARWISIREIVTVSEAEQQRLDDTVRRLDAVIQRLGGEQADRVTGGLLLAERLDVLDRAIERLLARLAQREREHDERLAHVESEITRVWGALARGVEADAQLTRDVHELQQRHAVRP